MAHPAINMVLQFYWPCISYVLFGNKTQLVLVAFFLIIINTIFTISLSWQELSCLSFFYCFRLEMSNQLGIIIFFFWIHHPNQGGWFISRIGVNVIFIGILITACVLPSRSNVFVITSPFLPNRNPAGMWASSSDSSSIISMRYSSFMWATSVIITALAPARSATIVFLLKEHSLKKLF